MATTHAEEKGAGAKAQGHSALGASSCERYCNCPGSVAAHAAAPRPPESAYAAEGHVAHHLGELIMTGKIDRPGLFKMVGTTIRSEGGIDIKVTDEMVEAVLLYFDTVVADFNELKALNKPAPIKMLIEAPVCASSVDKEVWGTLDTGIILVGHSLDVYDYKHGQGKVVEAVENKQGLQYVLSVIDTIKCEAFDRIRFTIVQPRAPHSEGPVRRWVIPIERIRKFREELKVCVAATRQENAPRAAGDWCRWCNAQVDCPAKRALVTKETGAVFSEAAAAEAHVLMSPDDMTPEMIARALSVKENIESWFDAIKARAHQMLERGEKVPGYKLVNGKSNRQWKDEKVVIDKFEDVYGESIFKPRALLSPAQLEDVVGKKAVADLTVKPVGKPAIAPESDKRESAMPSGRAAFAHLEEKNVQEAVVVKSDEDLMGDL